MWGNDGRLSMVSGGLETTQLFRFVVRRSHASCNQLHEEMCIGTLLLSELRVAENNPPKKGSPLPNLHAR
jgi:hypothetical protein